MGTYKIYGISRVFLRSSAIENFSFSSKIVAL